MTILWAWIIWVGKSWSQTEGYCLNYREAENKEGEEVSFKS